MGNINNWPEKHRLITKSFGAVLQFWIAPLSLRSSKHRSLLLRKINTLAISFGTIDSEILLYAIISSSSLNFEKMEPSCVLYKASKFFVQSAFE